MGRTVSNAPGFAPDQDADLFDPAIDDFVSKDRSYVHFDLPLTEDERSQQTLANIDIAHHSFWPLLGFTKSERRIKRDQSGSATISVKEREIKFSSHRDAALFEYYSRKLSNSYENFLEGKPFNKSVLAYRSNVGDNIKQAKEIFDEIVQKGNVFAIALDIEKFFDRINHYTLQKSIEEINFVDRLNIEDYKIFVRMTNFEWVDSDQLKKRLGNLYRKNGRICNSWEFRKYIRAKPSLVQINKEKFGIPQGTPLSGLYANISMIKFDADAHEYLSALGATYRRYSDDIGIVCPSQCDPKKIIQKLEELLDTAGLKISHKKTDVCEFKISGKSSFSEKPFQYLGFTFDGKRILIRQSSLNRYYSKMCAGIRAKVRAAKSKDIAREEIYMRELFKRYTHFGKERNFPRYAYRASAIMNSNEIRKQLSNHFEYFKGRVRYYIAKAYN